MRNQFTVLLISSLLVSACFATTYPSSTYTTNCTSPQLHLTNAAATTCTAAGACTGGSSDVAPTSATANSAATATAAGDCKYCDATHVWDSALYNNCVLKASGACAATYSDNANNAAATTGSALTGACVNCDNTAFWNQLSTVSGAICIVKASNPTGCAARYSDVNTGTATAKGTTLTGDCKYCATGYSDLAPAGTPLANTAATTAGATAACSYCAPNYVWNQPSAVTGGMCVKAADATAGVCATGYADVSTGVYSGAGKLTGDCKYCLAGTSDLAPDATTKANKNATAAGATGVCKYCADGFTQTAVGSACTAVGGGSTSASFLMVSISVMATLIMIFF